MRTARTQQNALDTVPGTPARSAKRYLVTLTTGESFTVFVHRGSVPREKIAAQLAHHETVRAIKAEEK